MTTTDRRTQDIIAGASHILREIQRQPLHVRPWLRGIEAEAERVCFEVSAAGNDAAGRFLRWLTRDDDLGHVASQAKGANDNKTKGENGTC